MLIRFVSHKFSVASLTKIEVCSQIIEEYLTQNLRLTLRQLYYQLVTRNVIPNLEREYKNLSKLISDARLAGYVDWDVAQHGSSSWEVDALPPDVLAGIIRQALDSIVDRGAMERVKRKEERDKTKLKAALGRL